MAKNNSISDYLNQTKKSRRRGRKFFCVLFLAVLPFFCVVGLLMPLRPTRSLLEKRNLTKRPAVTARGIWDGSFFTGLTTWYADTYPAREQMISMNSALERIYGLQNEVLYGSSSHKTADAIPDTSSLSAAPLLTDADTAAGGSSNTASGAAAGSGSGSSKNGGESVQASSAKNDKGTASAQSGRANNSAQGGKGNASAQTAGQANGGAAASSSASGDSASASASNSAAANTASDGTIHQVPEAVGTVYITGNRGFDIYYFSQSGADTYASMINTVKARLTGYGLSTNLYDMVIPTSFGICLDDNVQQQLGGSLQKDAIPYIYGRIDSSVKKVSTFDALRKHNDEYLYFRTDHHWTALGAYYAYRQFCNTKGIKPHELSQFQEQDFPGFLGTYYSMSNQSPALAADPDTVQAWIPMGTNTMTMTEADGTTMDYPIVSDASVNSTENKYLAFIAGDQPYEEIHNPKITDGSTAVLIKESFGNCFAPFLVDHYQNLYIIDYRYYNGDLTQFCKDHNVTDVIFANNTEAITEERAQTMLALFPEHKK